jgi:hypothetical protein
MKDQRDVGKDCSERGASFSASNQLGTMARGAMVAQEAFREPLRRRRRSLAVPE